MTFTRPVFLYILPIVILVSILFQILIIRRKKKVLKKFLASGKSNNLNLSYNKIGIIKELFLLFALISFVFALSGPASESDLASLNKKGIDIIFTVDISRSMDAGENISKLQIAKNIIKTIIDERKNDRIALVLFSTGASIISPLTLDRRNIYQVISNLSSTYTTSHGTSIVSALEAAKRVIDFESNRSKVVILISDGENFGPEFNEGLSIFRNSNIPIITLGIGNADGDPVPFIDHTGKRMGYILLENSDTAKTYLEDITLQKISESTDGEYFFIASSNNNINEINSFLNRFDTKTFNEEMSKLLVFHYEIPLALAGIFIFLALIFERFRRKKL